MRAQVLDEFRPTDLPDVVHRLTLLQIDSGAAVAPSADLVAWSRLGSSYSPADLSAGLQDRTFMELRGMSRPAEDLASFPELLAEYFEVPRDQLDAKAVTDPVASVHVDVRLLTEQLRGDAFFVTGLVYDVETGLVEQVVPPTPLHNP